MVSITIANFWTVLSDFKRNLIHNFDALQKKLIRS